MMRFFLVCLFCLFAALPAAAQESVPDAPITVADGPEDAAIEARLRDLFGRLSDTRSVTVSVGGSVVTLGGDAPNEAAAERAVALASRTDGVVAVQDDIQRTLDVTDNVSPLLSRMSEWTAQAVRALPLVGAALLVLVGLTLFGRFLSRRQALLSRLVTNPFLMELIANAIRVVFLVAGVVAALNILGATALVGTVLGGAGIIGVALGFGVRDTVENYIASLLLSLRQPFRAQDHVVIDGKEGIVVRLNTRATILMTLDGNHLRIPNAKVFKADILNYTTNPERRFCFRVGVDSSDDPVAAIALGSQVMDRLDFVLDDPPPDGKIVEVGDSSIVIDYFGWVDQRETGFSNARSQAIRDVKNALEAEGFSLPEPIYRVKMDGVAQAAPKPGPHADAAPRPAPISPAPAPATPFALDTDAELTIQARVAQERQLSGQTDLLDADAPPE